MARGVSNQKSKQLARLPEVYNQLLLDYVEILENLVSNPYELSVKKRIWSWFDISGQIKYARSPHIVNFMKIPNALAQELPGASDMLEHMNHFDNQTLQTITEMNNMNLNRLKRRSITEIIVPGLAFVGGVLGLLPALQSVFPISINQILLPWFPWLTISFLLKILLIGSLMIAIANRTVTGPRIGIVDALGGILNIAITFHAAK